MTSVELTDCGENDDTSYDRPILNPKPLATVLAIYVVAGHAHLYESTLGCDAGSRGARDDEVRVTHPKLFSSPADPFLGLFDDDAEGDELGSDPI